MYKKKPTSAAISLMLYQPSAWACMVADGSYEKADSYLWVSVLLVCLGLLIYLVSAPSKWKLALSILSIVLVVPVTMYVVNSRICCDCGHGELLWSQFIFGGSVLILILSIMSRLWLHRAKT